MIESIYFGLAAAAIAGAARPHILANPSASLQGQDEQAVVRQSGEAPPAPQTGGGSHNPNYFNPQISLVTDFRANIMDNSPTATRRAFFKEAELGLAADIDPYLRGEAYIAFADEDGETVAEVEEAFATYDHLGKGFSAKFGKIAAAIGRVQRNHADQLNWLDYPFVVQDMLGEEGMRAGGGSLSYLFPGDRFHEITVEAIDAGDEGLFGGANTAAPVWVGHYRTFFDFNEDSSAQLGLTYANGPGGGVGNARSSLFGADFTYKWQPGTAGKSMTIEAEAYWGKSGMAGLKSVFGAFAALTYELKPRLFGTLKYDYSEIPGTFETRRGLSLGATLKVTEFHYWRAEWQRITSSFAPDRNVLNLQFQWLIGAHPAHKY